MYKLLVVDDEIAVVNGMTYDIDWSELGISEVFKAFNGIQALDCIRMNRIDVVIADISMPEMDGFEMVKKLRTKWSHIRVIFLTGHSEFEYARDAIDLGVSGYITKPAADDEVKAAVQKALLEIEQDMRQKELLVNTEMQLKNLIPVLQEKYLISWIVQGYSSPDREPEKWKSCDLQLRPHCGGFLVLIRIDDSERSADFPKINKATLRGYIRNLLIKGTEPIYFEDFEENLVLLIQKENDAEEQIRYIEQMADIFQETIQKTMGCVISIFISGAADNLNKMHYLYRRLIQAIRSSMTMGDGIIVVASDSRYFSEQNRLHTLDTYVYFLSYLEKLHKAEAVGWINKVFSEFKKTKKPSYNLLLQIYHHISLALINFSIIESIEYEDWLEKGAECLENFQRIKSIESLKSWSLNSVEALIDLACDKKSTNAGNLVQHAKSIIHERLENNVTLTDLSSSLHVNASYLSRLFKKQTGLTIIDYIIQLKMEKARKLLEQPNSKVCDVAQKLGYESAAHFSRLFKRETGVNPKDYSGKK